MPDVEKVIKGLEHCTKHGFDCNTDRSCPYNPCINGHDCIDTVMRDALALLKAQEPRVMAGEELTDAELIEEIRKAPLVLKPNVDAVPVVHGLWDI